MTLIDRLPSHLITLEGDSFIDFTTAVETLRFCTQKAVNYDLVQRQLMLPSYRDVNVVHIIHRELVKCPDELPPEDIAGLDFIEDLGQRSDLRLDIARIRDSFIRGDWKSATVLAGAAIEALLLWKIIREGHEIWKAAAEKAKISKWVKDGKDPNHWELEDYLKVAKEARFIGDATATQCRLAQGFRNLIHPGREQRLQMRCDRATALSAEAGLEHVIREFSGETDGRVTR
jgi:hypothetical protein